MLKSLKNQLRIRLGSHLGSHLGSQWELRLATPLSLALICSVGLHAILLSLHFEVPERVDRLFQNNHLPLILVNIRLKANTNEHAQAVAQTNLTGGGEDNSSRLRSPLASATKTVETQDSEDIAQRLERQEAELKSLEAEQTKLLAQAREQLASLNTDQSHPLTPDLESKRQRLLQMLAEIDARIEQSNKRPHKRYFSPSTRESDFAVYYDQMRQRIESFGTKHFPTYQGRKLYGSLIITVTVNASGQVVSVDVVEGSGQSELDRRAKAIVMSSGPFPIFTASLSSKAEQIALISKFSFTESGALGTLELQSK